MKHCSPQTVVFVRKDADPAVSLHQLELKGTPADRDLHINGRGTGTSQSAQK